MKYNRVWAKLLGLVYVLALFLLGVSPPMVVVEQAPVREGEAPVVTAKPVSVAITEKDVTLSAGTFTTGTENLSVVLQPGEKIGRASCRERVLRLV